MNSTKKMKNALIVLGVILVIVLLHVLLLAGKGCKHVDDSIDNAVINYETYTEIYHSCEKINLDLCNMKSMPDSDVSFSQFSKPQRINTLKSKLNGLVEEYNAKSKMINRSIWKRSDLPYQLSETQFSCY